MKNYPSVLSFTASIAPSIFSMYALKEDKEFSKIKKEDLSTVEIQEQTVRGTISNYLDEATYNEATKKGKNRPEEANIQKIEVATLPPDSEYLYVEGGVRFYAQNHAPNNCNSNEFTKLYKEFRALVIEKVSFKELALRYFINLINGSILWRNKFGENLITNISLYENNITHDFKLASVDLTKGFSFDIFTNQEDKEVAKQIVEKIQEALESKMVSSGLYIKIKAKLHLGFGVAVFPSQEFIEGEEVKRLSKTKMFSKQAIVPTLHSQKVGNAIRTVDTWYDDTITYENALAIEPFGVSQNEKIAYRLPATKKDFYTYFQKLDTLTEELKKGTIPSDINFIIACVIRGGVYGIKKDK